VYAPEAPAGFIDQVVARVLYDRQAHRSRRRRWLVVTALAASLLLAVLAGRLWSPKGAEPSLPSNPAPIAHRDEKTRAAPSPRDSAAEAGQAVASLSHKAKVETVEQTRLLWPVASTPLSFEGLDLQTPLEPPSQSLREAGQNVSSGLEPVTHSARRAMNLFWRDLPPVEPAKKQGS
jgi:hypothetical protein